MPKIKINTFGEGIEIRQLHLEPDVYQHWMAIAAKKNRPLTELILDPFFYHGLKDKKIKHFADIESTLIGGMLDSAKSQIEVWFERRKVLKVQSLELFNEMVLFPLFQIERNADLNSSEFQKGTYVIQKTIGLLNSKYLEVNCQKLNVDDFTFLISKYDAHQFLTNITYQNQHLNFKKSETMITYQTAFEIK